MTATRWMAALIWRSPPRSSRWRLVLAELTGIGARPAARASLASELKRSAPAILVAVTAPKPGSESSRGPNLGGQGREFCLFEGFREECWGYEIPVTPTHLRVDFVNSATREATARIAVMPSVRFQGQTVAPMVNAVASA